MRGVAAALGIGSGLLLGLAAASGQPSRNGGAGLPPAHTLELGGGSLELDVPRLPVTPERHPELRGRVVVFNIFVGGPESRWSGDDEAEVNRQLDSALARLRSHAREHRVEVSWVRDRAAVDLDQEVSSDPERWVDWTDDAIRAATGESPSELADRLRGYHGADHAVVLLHIKPAGRSYCVPFFEPARVVMTRRLLVDFSPHDTGAGKRIPLFERPIAYAHEILHAFGAEDLYQPEERRVVAERLYPDDVMLAATAGDDFAIGPCTAHRIGWGDAADDPEMCP